MIDFRERAGIAMSTRGAFTDATPDRKVTLGALAFANELGRLLWRMKYGQDVKRAGIARASLLFSESLRNSRPVSRTRHGRNRLLLSSSDRSGPQHGEVYDRLAAAVLDEWVNDRCPTCKGRGTVGGKEASASARVETCAVCDGAGVLIDEHLIPFAAHPEGSGPLIYRVRSACPCCDGTGKAVARTTIPHRQICPDCNGTGTRPVNRALRARHLGLPLRTYEHVWHTRFESALTMLDNLDALVNDTMRQQHRCDGLQNP
ncbi:DnaJ-like cysteine-rich domain-containing protein [Chitinasiproducens palmae]|uniref:CR-type domain-containing protein n=1 Tax=Chitinasiproducens palmae TaxID=1770053 RepID=A0A1H2PMT7_9BURK|nr:zinc finger-like domain-containing protein [Chitinasiproducens palmae]SDV47927.1 hypothetical protein SAMN05216551_1045 [Chitinasiproducens palmae]